MESSYAGAAGCAETIRVRTNKPRKTKTPQLILKQRTECVSLIRRGSYVANFRHPDKEIAVCGVRRLWLDSPDNKLYTLTMIPGLTAKRCTGRNPRSFRRADTAFTFTASHTV
jgi:hypothetical protein